MLTTIYLIAAVVGGTVLVCQFVLALLGLGHDGGDLDHGGAHWGDSLHGDTHVGDMLHGHAGHAGSEAHPDSTHLFAIVSFKTLIAAAAFFGVTGLATINSDFPATTSLLFAVLAGAFAMYGMYWLLRLVAGLGSAGNERIGNAVGLAATVYVPIPPTGLGAGKVQLSMQNRIVEYQAVTADTEPLRTGETVEVVAIKSSDTVEVRRAGKRAEEPVTC